MIVAVDPGDTCGIANWTNEGDLLSMTQCTLEELPKLLINLNESEPISVIVVEDYRLFGKRAQAQIGSRMKAPKGIGVVEGLAAVFNCKVVLQNASIKSIASKWSQVTVPSDHSMSHKYDAFLHGYYWLAHPDQAIIKTQLELEMEDRRNA